MLNTVSSTIREHGVYSIHSKRKSKASYINDIKQSEIKQNELGTKNNASINDIYLKESSQSTRHIESLDNTPTKETFYNEVPLKTWSLNDPKHTDADTGISWYVRDGSPYMLQEDSEKFRRLCEESGELPLKKFARLTGLIQQLDENTVAFVGDNGTAIKSKDGKELFIDTSKMTYDLIMDMFNSISNKGNYFDSNYWKDNISNS